MSEFNWCTATTHFDQTCAGFLDIYSSCSTRELHKGSIPQCDRCEDIIANEKPVLHRHSSIFHGVCEPAGNEVWRLRRRHGG